MRKKLLQFTTIAIILLLSACNNDEIFDKNDNPALPTGRTLSLTATMPGDDPTTRVGLEQLGDKSIELTWEKTDELQLAFVQGEGESAIKIKSIAKVKSISEDGKKAQFEILIPDLITDDVFNLYGVYGGGGLVETDPTKVILPTNPGDATSLASIKERKDVMLHFASKDIQAANPEVSVVFNHLGSLFNITLKNTGEDISDLNCLFLAGYDQKQKWAYNMGAGGETYDLVNGEFLNQESANFFFIFMAEKNTLLSEESMSFWGWYPPLPDVVWPKLQLMVERSSGEYGSKNSKPARTTPTAAGQSYYLYATIDGRDLNFTDESFSPDLGPGRYHVMPMGSLSTMLNKTQRDTITTMIITGEINKADFEVMKKEIPNLTYVDLKDVTCENNEIPKHAIGDYRAGQNNTTITTIILPESITEIGGSSFEMCTGLTGSLTIPDEVTTIAMGAFNGCTGLTGSLHLSKSLKIIGLKAFYKCSGFTGNLIIPKSVTSIEAEAFTDCSGFTGSLTIPEGVTVINAHVFSGCRGFTGSLTIPEGVASIGEFAFYECGGFTGSLTIPESVTSIGTFALNSCINIDAFRFPHTTPIVYTRNMVASKATVEVPKVAVATYKAAEGWKNHNIVGYGLLPHEYHVMPMGSLSAMLTQEQKDTITTMIITGEINKADFEVMKLEIPNLTYVDLKDVTCEGNKIPNEAFGGWQNSNKTISTVILPKSVTSIGAQAFLRCTSLEGELNLPHGLNVVGDWAFEGCSKLTGSLTIPHTVTNIGINTFKGCIGFGELNLSHSLTRIGQEGFRGCTGLSGTVNLPESLSHIGNLGFEECNNVSIFLIQHTKSLTYSDKMLPPQAAVQILKTEANSYKAAKGWADHVLIAYHPNLSLRDYYVKPSMGTLDHLLNWHKANIEKMIVTGTINKADFEVMKLQMPKLRYLDLSNVTCENNTIPDEALGGWDNSNKKLTDLTLPKSVTSIGQQALLRCTGLVGNLELPSGLQKIGRFAFEGCEGLSGHLKIPQNVTHINQRAFYGCNKFSGLTLPDGLTTVGPEAFYDCISIYSRIILPGSLTSIGESAFYKCDNVTAFQLYNNELKYTENMLPTNAIVETTNLPHIIAYLGNKEGWKDHFITAYDVTRAYNVDAYGKLRWIVGDEKSFIQVLKLTGYINKDDFEVMKREMSELRYVNLSSVKCLYDAIPQSAFGDAWRGDSPAHDRIGIIVLPNSIKEIGQSAFENCADLMKIYLPDGLTKIRDEAFKNCSGITYKVIIPQSVETIESLAFIGCDRVSAFRFTHTTPIAYGREMLPHDAKVEVPNSAVNKYKAANGWKDFNITFTGY